MKRLIYILLITVLTLGCSNDDDNSSSDDPTIHTTWSLINVSGGLAGVDDDFEVGVITWDFDLQTQKLTVINTNTTDVIYDGFESGVYDYEVLSATGNDATILVNEISLDVETLSASQMILDEGIAFDGFLLTFSK